MSEVLPFEQINRGILVKKKAVTSSKFGCVPDERSVEELINYGIVNIDKPRGPTSHQVSAYVQQILGIRKSGHSGTLDPKVTGVLPIALGRATKIVQTLLPAGKEYIAIMHLHKDIAEEKIKAVFKEFTGKIKQLPPVKSSVKRRLRERKIYYLDIMEIEGRDCLFRAGVEAGTYIRKLISDIGLALGIKAHMIQLRRTKVACFDETTLVTLQDLADSYWYWKNKNNEKYIRHCIKPVEFAIKHIPKIYVLDTTVDSICHGANLNVPGISKIETGIEENQTAAIMSLKNELIALGRAELNSEKMLKAEKGLAVKTKKVFMLSETYPKIEKKTSATAH